MAAPSIDEVYPILQPGKLDKLLLCGLLDASSKTVYGFSKSKKPYKLFTPFNNKFPKFIVQYKGNGTNCIVSIKYVAFDSKLRYPLGQITQSFGSVSNAAKNMDLLIIYAAALIHYNGYCHVSKVKFDVSLHMLNSIYYSDSRVDNYHVKKNDFKFICNIDPEGCEDIDDLVSYHEDGDKRLIGVHIIDIIYVLSLFKTLGIDAINRDRFSTVYGYRTNWGILPDILIENFLSLAPGNKKYVWSVYLNISSEHEIIDYNLKTEIIYNQKSYSYESVSTKNLDILPDFCNQYGKKHLRTIYDAYENHLDNSHYIISVLMIIANRVIGQELIMRDDMIYRVTDEMCGKYSFNDKKNMHFNLQISNYTHFTSPIRRFVDQYVHSKLYENKFGFKPLDFDISPEMLININEALLETKDLNNKYKMLNLVSFERLNSCKLIEIKYSDDRVYLKWFVQNAGKIIDSLDNVLVEKISDTSLYFNSFLEDETIGGERRLKLDLNMVLDLKILFLVRSKHPQLCISYEV